MAYKTFDESAPNTPQNEQISLKIDGPNVTVPDASFIKESTITRDGGDLVLTNADTTLTVEGYYNAETAPTIISPDGASLTPALVNSFATSTARFASADASTSDVSHVGAVNEVSGHATVTRLDGTKIDVTSGTKIFQGDIVETDANGAVNIIFQDDTKFAISEDARLAIDEYVYDPITDAGTTNFSVLKGVFVFTSGLIGREDPDDVHIETPVGSIGIRGTIIAGDVNSGEITVVEGAIVLNDFNGNEITLANQFETAKFGSNGGGIEHMGELAAHEVAGRFAGVSGVAPDLFSSINDAAQETQQDGNEAKPEGEDATQAQDEQGADAENADGQDPADTEAQEAAADSEEAEALAEETQAQDAEAEGEAKSEGKEAGAKEKGPAEDARAQDADKAEAKPEGEQAAEQQTPQDKAAAQEARQEAAEAKAEAKMEAQAQANAKAEGRADGQTANGQDTAADATKPADQQQNAGQDATNQPTQSQSPAQAQAQQSPTAGTNNFGQNAGQALGTEALNFSLGTNGGIAGNPNVGPSGPAGSLPSTLAAAGDGTTTPPPLPLIDDGTAAGDTGTNVSSLFLDVLSNPILENTTGLLGTVSIPAGVTGATITSVIFHDPTVYNFVDIIQIDSATWEFHLKVGETLDFEDTDANNTYLDFTANITDTNGTSTYSDFLYVDVIGVNETVTHHFSEPTDTLVTHEGATRIFHLGKDFYDPEGNLTFMLGQITARIDYDADGNFSSSSTEAGLGIDLDGGGLGVTLVSETEILTDLSQLTNYLDLTYNGGTGWSFDSNTGQLTLAFDNTFNYDLSLDIEITATDGISSETATYTIQAKELNSDHSGEGTGKTGQTMGGTDETIIATAYNDSYSITGDDNNLFTLNGYDTVNLSGTGNFVNTGDGIDTITLNAAGTAGNIAQGGNDDDIFNIAGNAGLGAGSHNTLIGGEGSDTFNIIRGANNKLFGGENDDSFVFKLINGTYENILVDLQSNAVAYQDKFFDGNSGFDTIEINGGVGATIAQRTLDFTNIDDNTFRNIESINLLDAADYKVTLTAEDVFQMTDNENTLHIEGDAGDEVNLTNDGGKAFNFEYNDGTYNSYSNGDVTIIIDADVTVTAGSVLAGL